MNYNFKSVFSGNRVLGKNEFRRMMSFIHAYNDIKAAGVTNEGQILRQLIARGFNDASAINQIVKRIAGGVVPSVEEENEFMGQYFNYTQELRREAEEKLEAQEKHYNENKVFEVDGRTYSAKELSEIGPKAKKAARRSKLARLGVVLAGALVLGTFAPALVTGVFAGLVSTSTLSFITTAAGFAGLGFGAYFGKRVYDMGGRKAKLQNNSNLASLYENSKDLIREQQLAIESARDKVYSLEDAFGIQRDAYGNETNNAYNDIYNDFSRESATPTPIRPQIKKQQTPNRTPNKGFTFEDVDEFIKGAYSQDEEDKEEQKTNKLDPSFGRNMTIDDIDNMIEDVYGKQSSVNSANKIDDKKSIVKSTLDKEYSEKAQEYADYIIDKRLSGIVPSERISDLRDYVENELDIIADDTKSADERIDAFKELKNTYVDAHHRLNMQKLAKSLGVFKELKDNNPEYEDVDLDRLVERIGKIKADFENSNDYSEEALDASMEQVKFEEGLVDILSTYAVVKDNQARTRDRERTALTNAEQKKYATWSDEHQKFMHIVIENALDEGKTLEELQEMIEGDDHEYISYMACRRDANEINDLLQRKEKYTQKQEEVQAAAHNVIAVQSEEVPAQEEQSIVPFIAPAQTSQPIEEPKEISNAAENVVTGYPSPVEVADEIMRREAVQRERNTKLQELAEEQVKAQQEAQKKAEEEARKARRKANMERAKALYEVEPAQEELEPVVKSASNLPPQMAEVIAVIEEQNSASEKISSKPVKDIPKVTFVSEIYKQNVWEDVEKACTEARVTSNAAGRYLINVIKTEALNSIIGAKTAENVDARAKEAKTAIEKIRNNYKLYTGVDILNKKTGVKVKYFREITEEDASKTGEVRGEKSTIKNLHTENIAETTFFNTLVKEYLSDFANSCNGVIDLIDGDKKVAKEKINEAKKQLKIDIKNAFKAGEEPLAAVDRIMSQAYKNLEAFVDSNNIAAIDKGIKKAEESQQEV